MRERLAKNTGARRLALGAAAASLGFVAACGGSAEKTDASPSNEAGVRVVPSPSAGVTALKGVEVTFDWLGGNSTDILVYGDYSESGRNTDKGAEKSGDRALAVCESEGREVHSQPGETARKSSEWVGFYLNGSLTYATETYLDVPAAVHGLPDCTTVPPVKPQ